ncbi:MAG: fasciclin domain-containing protein, partial [Pricia sp.]
FIIISNSISAQNASTPTLAKTVITVKKSIAATATSSENYSTLKSVMEATGFKELLDGSAPFTIFAPSDKAFERLQGVSVNDLLDANDIEELKALLGYHIIAGKISASKMLRALCQGEGKAEFTTIQGDIIKASIDGIDIVLTDSFGNSATIVVADSNQSNGVIHQIDGVIRPNFPQ